MITYQEYLNHFNNLKHNQTLLPYANPTSDGKSYGGWVTNFHIHLKGQTQNMSLDLHNQVDLFLLFVLAVAWSRNDNWENSAFFTSYLKMVKHIDNMDKVREWVTTELTGNYQELSKRYAEEERRTLVLDSGITTNNGSRNELSVRYDTLISVKILFDNWNNIKTSLEQSHQTGNYMTFINCVRSIDGLGPIKGNKKLKMSMKILLILRELRIQNIYNNIPGELCCVPDARVKIAANNISNLNLHTSNTFEYHLKNSKIIYEIFGDWYDVPLFAFEDVER